MKIRETINSNAEKFSAIAYEDQNKVVVVKHDNDNYYDRSTDERLVFDSVTEYRAWISTQSWIVPAKVKKVSKFKEGAKMKTYRVKDEFIDRWFGNLSTDEIGDATVTYAEILRLSNEWGVSVDDLMGQVEEA